MIKAVGIHYSLSVIPAEIDFCVFVLFADDGDDDDDVN